MWANHAPTYQSSVHKAQDIKVNSASYTTASCNSHICWWLSYAIIQFTIPKKACLHITKYESNESKPDTRRVRSYSIALAVFLHSSQQARRAAKETGVEQHVDLRGGGSRDEAECKQQCATHFALVPLSLGPPPPPAAAQRNTRWNSLFN